MTASVPIIALRCHYCSRYFHPKEFVQLGESALQCWSCWEQQKIQIEAFNPPAECQGCRRSFEVIAAATVGDHVKMYPVWKDGIYQVLCEPCEAAYVQQRRDLYGDTRFGWERKLW